METDNDYLNNIIQKYDFIEGIIITDDQGILILSSYNKSLDNKDNYIKNLRTILSYYFSSSLDKVSRTVKWKTNSITSFYDKYIIYQRKLNEIAICNFICKENDYCHIIIKNLSDEICKKFEPIKNKLKEIKEQIQNEND